MRYEFRNINIESIVEVRNAIEALRDFVDDPNTIGLKDLCEFPNSEFYHVWMLKDKFVVERVEGKEEKAR